MYMKEVLPSFFRGKDKHKIHYMTVKWNGLGVGNQPFQLLLVKHKKRITPQDIKMEIMEVVAANRNNPVQPSSLEIKTISHSDALILLKLNDPTLFKGKMNIKKVIIR